MKKYKFTGLYKQGKMIFVNIDDENDVIYKTKYISPKKYQYQLTKGNYYIIHNNKRIYFNNNFIYLLNK